MHATDEESEKQRRIQAAANMLAHLLKGESFTRKTLPDDVGQWNYSLHTLATHLRVKRLIPVATRRDGPRAVYFMEPREIRRYHNQRDAQRRAQARRVTELRLNMGLAAITRLAGVLRHHPKLAKKEAARLEAAVQSLNQAIRGGKACG